MKRKSFLLVVFTLLMIFAVFGTTAWAADTPTSGTCGDNVNWSYDASTETLTISGSGAMMDYNDTNNRAPWISTSTQQIKSVIIEDGVTKIGAYAFYGIHSYLESVTVPGTLTKIGMYSFLDCEKLQAVYISDFTSWLNIDFDSNPCEYSHTLYLNGELLTDVVISAGTTVINRNVFDGCSCIKSVIIHEGVTDINASAFEGCSGLTDVRLPESIKNISRGAFSDCTGLKSINIPDGVRIINDNTFRNCSSLESITIPEGVEGILNAFDGCSSLTEVTIPKNVSVLSTPFPNCKKLTAINVEDGNTNFISKNGVLYNKDETKLIQFPGAMGGDYKISDTVTDIGEYAFAGCDKLVTVVIPEGVTVIKDHIFDGCEVLLRVNIPKGVTEIGNFAFDGCNNLEDITFPDSLNSIGNFAFNGCAGLKNVNMADGLTSIGSSAFENCVNLESIKLPKTMTSIGSSAFTDCQKLQSIAIPDGITEIGRATFERCSSLGRITIPNSVVSVGNVAFFRCSNLKDVYYRGSAEEWENIQFDKYGDILNENKDSIKKDVTIHFRATVSSVFDAKFAESVTKTVDSPDFTKTAVLTTGNGAISYYSSNNDVATVDNNGKVTIKGVGNTTITAIAEETDDYLSAEISYVLTVNEKTTTGGGGGGGGTAGKPTEPAKPVTPPTQEESENPFVDVTKGVYYYDAVLWAVKSGVTTGTSDTMFSPDMPCTRAQAVTFMWRAAGSPEPGANMNPFGDVSANAYYYKSVLWAVENGIVKGTSATTFSPDDLVTRGQIVACLWREKGEPAVEAGNVFVDVLSNAYYYNAVIWAAEHNITQGTSSTEFSPATDCTRGQIVTFLYNNSKLK